MKIAVIGYSGSGKSTLSKELSVRYQLPLLYLDSVHFLPGWVEREDGEAKRIVKRFLEQKNWVIDGNYLGLCGRRKLREADIVIFLKFSRLSCLFRILKRFLKNRRKTRESMAEGCQEKLDPEFLLWVLWNGRTRKAARLYRLAAGRYPEKILVIRNQRQLTAFKNRFL